MLKYYCSNKFSYLKIMVDTGIVQICHAADGETLSMDWLESNYKNLFNTPGVIKERKLMLKDKFVQSCEKTCYSCERIGRDSHRLQTNGFQQTHTDIISSPETVDICINTECSQSCIYCCKEFSTTYKQDIIKNGPYILSQGKKYEELNDRDKVLSKLTFDQKRQSKKRNLIIKGLQEIISKESVKLVRLTGGEPLLDKTIFDFITKTNPAAKIEVWTGLGINCKKFEEIINRLKDFNVHFVISAESVGQIHDLIRYGANWTDVQNKVKTLESCGFQYTFHQTLTNLSAITAHQFLEQYGHLETHYNTLSYPTFLRTYVLDDKTKDFVNKQLSQNFHPIAKKYIDGLDQNPSNEERLNLSLYLKEFSRRRNIDLSFLPASFLEFIEF